MSKKRNSHLAQGRRPVVRRISIPVTDIMQEAIEAIIRPRSAFDTRERHAWLLRQILAEGLFALADRLENDGNFRASFRFDVSDEGDRRGAAREKMADAIDAVLAAAGGAREGLDAPFA